MFRTNVVVIIEKNEDGSRIPFRERLDEGERQGMAVMDVYFPCVAGDKKRQEGSYRDKERIESGVSHGGI